MTEEELRIGALEQAIIALAATLPPGLIKAAMNDIRQGLPAMTMDETAMRNGAIQLLDDGMRRHDGAEFGMMVPRPKG